MVRLWHTRMSNYGKVMAHQNVKLWQGYGTRECRTMVRLWDTRMSNYGKVMAHQNVKLWYGYGTLECKTTVRLWHTRMSKYGKLMTRQNVELNTNMQRCNVKSNSVSHCMLIKTHNFKLKSSYATFVPAICVCVCEWVCVCVCCRDHISRASMKHIQ
jgi:hypothetical protein